MNRWGRMRPEKVYVCGDLESLQFESHLQKLRCLKAVLCLLLSIDLTQVFWVFWVYFDTKNIDERRHKTCKQHIQMKNRWIPHNIVKTSLSLDWVLATYIELLKLRISRSTYHYLSTPESIYCYQRTSYVGCTICTLNTQYAQK